MKINILHILYDTFVALLSGLTVSKNEKEMWVTSANSGITIELLDAEEEIYIIRNYWENGQLKWERHFKSKEQHGLSRGYFDNGAPEHHCNWVNGKLDGEYVLYYNNDSKRFSKVTYINGEPGETIWFDLSGEQPISWTTPRHIRL